MLILHHKLAQKSRADLIFMLAQKMSSNNDISTKIHDRKQSRNRGFSNIMQLYQNSPSCDRLFIVNTRQTHQVKQILSKEKL